MTSLATVTMIGRLVRDPEMKGRSGALCTFSLAVNRREKVGDSWTDEVSFFDCKIVGRRAESFEKHHKKGDLVLLPAAELVQERWEQEGAKRSRIVVRSWGWEFMPRGSGEASGTAPSDEGVPF